MGKNIVNEKFEKIKDYLIKIENNIDKDYFEFQIGIPEKWYYKSNDVVQCEDLKEIENYGTIVKVYPQKEGVYIDEIINFIIKTIETNNRISEMEKAFKEKMESEKEKIKNEAEQFYSKINDLREKSFENLDDDENIEDNLQKIQSITETFDNSNKSDDTGDYTPSSGDTNTYVKSGNDLKNIDDTKKNISNLGEDDDSEKQESMNKDSKKGKDNGINKGTKNK